MFAPTSHLPGEATSQPPFRNERFFRTLIEECLWHHRFTGRNDAFVVIAACLEKYHRERPHSAPGYLTPKEFAETPALAVRKRGERYRPPVRSVETQSKPQALRLLPWCVYLRKSCRHSVARTLGVRGRLHRTTETVRMAHDEGVSHVERRRASAC